MNFFKMQYDTVTQRNAASQETQDNKSSFNLHNNNALLLYSADPEMLHAYEKLSNFANIDPLQSLDEALKAAQKYQDEPLFAYHLGRMADRASNTELAKQIKEDNYRKFPFYLLIRCNYGMQCLQAGKLTDAASAINYTFDFRALNAQKSDFHFIEFLAFYEFIIEYFCDLQDFDRAVYHLAELISINKDFPGVSEFRTKIINSVLRLNLSKGSLGLLFWDGQEEEENDTTAQPSK